MRKDATKVKLLLAPFQVIAHFHLKQFAFFQDDFFLKNSMKDVFVFLKMKSVLAPLVELAGMYFP
jgi:hypothetical protein